MEQTMAHSKSALKRWRQNERHRARNKPVRTSARTSVRKTRAAIADGGVEEAMTVLREAMSVLDRAAKRNVIHRNAVARHKSRLMRALNRVTAEPAAEAPKRARKTTAKKTTAKKAPAKRASKSKS
jgi:small subunit ribosomal protein S20